MSLSDSGELEFAEFCTLAARFLVEEDAEAMLQELKEAFRLYDREGKTLEIQREGSKDLFVAKKVRNGKRKRLL